MLIDFYNDISKIYIKYRSWVDFLLFRIEIMLIESRDWTDDKVKNILCHKKLDPTPPVQGSW